MQNKERYENLQHGIYRSVGTYDIPQLHGINEINFPKFIGFNFARTDKHPEEKGLHFFLDDYQFNRIWNKPVQYLHLIQKFQCVLTPDFSLYTDFPVAMQIYNHYRKHWIGAFWEEHGVTVIPTIGWSDRQSFEWCFDGEPTGGVVAVSSIGTQNHSETKAAFLYGYDAMLERLQPKTILFYGNVPKECKGNIVHIPPLYEKFKR